MSQQKINTDLSPVNAKVGASIYNRFKATLLMVNSVEGKKITLQNAIRSLLETAMLAYIEKYKHLMEG